MKPKSSTNYIKIVDAVLDQINHGQLQKGDKLPTELSLATKFDVSRTCVREAIKTESAPSEVSHRENWSSIPPVSQKQRFWNENVT